MDFSVSTLAAGLIYGACGLYLLRRGKATAHVPWIMIGFALMVYPYFVWNPILVWAIGAGLLFAAAKS